MGRFMRTARVQADDRVAVQRIFLGGVLPLLSLAVLFTWREMRSARRRNGRPDGAGRRSR